MYSITFGGSWVLILTFGLPPMITIPPYYQRVLLQCVHVRKELSTQFTLIVTSQRQKKATPPTEERKYTIVQDARSLLVDQKFWRFVWRPTKGKGYLIVFSARSHLVLLDTWISKRSRIAEKRCTFAQNARSLLVELALWKRICSSTVEKRPTLAQNARSHLVK